MPKLTDSKLKIKKQIQSDFEKLLLADEKEEIKAQKLFAKEFENKLVEQKRTEKRISKKVKLESKKINTKSKRALKEQRLKSNIFYDTNGIAFKSKQKTIMLATPIIISKEFLENDFLNFLVNNFSASITKFVKGFKVKDKYLFTIGYHFYFEGLSGNKTITKGFRPKREMPIKISDIIITLQELFLEIKKRFDVYYLRAGSHILKFSGITLEASEK